MFLRCRHRVGKDQVDTVRLVRDRISRPKPMPGPDVLGKFRVTDLRESREVRLRNRPEMHEIRRNWGQSWGGRGRIVRANCLQFNENGSFGGWPGPDRAGIGGPDRRSENSGQPAKHMAVRETGAAATGRQVPPTLSSEAWAA